MCRMCVHLTFIYSIFDIFSLIFLCRLRFSCFREFSFFPWVQFSIVFFPLTKSSWSRDNSFSMSNLFATSSGLPFKFCSFVCRLSLLCKCSTAWQRQCQQLHTRRTTVMLHDSFIRRVILMTVLSPVDAHSIRPHIQFTRILLCVAIFLFQLVESVRFGFIDCACLIGFNSDENCAISLRLCEVTAKKKKEEEKINKRNDCNLCFCVRSFLFSLFGFVRILSIAASFSRSLLSLPSTLSRFSSFSM